MVYLFVSFRATSGVDQSETPESPPPITRRVPSLRPGANALRIVCCERLVVFADSATFRTNDYSSGISREISSVFWVGSLIWRGGCLLPELLPPGA